MSIKNYRLYIPFNLCEGAIINLDSNLLHYISIVLRLKDNQLIRVFNSKDGEFVAKFSHNKKDSYLTVTSFMQKSKISPYLHLGIAVLKNSVLPEMINQATQLGVTHITLLQTSYSQNHSLNIHRYQKIATEAIEQCGRFDLPNISGPIMLDEFLKVDLDLLIFANEKEIDSKLLKVQNWPERVGLLIGPEGGFSLEEAQKIQKLPHALSVKLSDNILRAETAATALLAQIVLLR
ncbi:Putative 16S ribosomal RNA methyltransferase RsmE [Candidatus Phycorickettsia trachydisci]|uniref:Ribosomal RNA small subunit methyltransferase E n=1 Tax=Candidatus Phycorickettsia trachydisci TaxID=2115978 RepID=A0A2P1P8A9_9RICK|nr:RsmE family RNA methyltransferase [Candidatus Phycorickettsia trachydisci]AVP87485.1 Putative 16S ribosomal RNA methyltransferase RsmE [Candidatus Phycorickettsia trachydisci]